MIQTFNKPICLFWFIYRYKQTHMRARVHISKYDFILSLPFEKCWNIFHLHESVFSCDWDFSYSTNATQPLLWIASEWKGKNNNFFFVGRREKSYRLTQKYDFVVSISKYFPCEWWMVSGLHIFHAVNEFRAKTKTKKRSFHAKVSKNMQPKICISPKRILGAINSIHSSWLLRWLLLHLIFIYMNIRLLYYFWSISI